jgi:hypothetical protein
MKKRKYTNLITRRNLDKLSTTIPGLDNKLITLKRLFS